MSLLCKDCRFFMPTYSVAGVCNFVLPPYMPRPFDTNVSQEATCDFGQAKPGKRGRPRKLIEESDDADE